MTKQWLTKWMCGWCGGALLAFSCDPHATPPPEDTGDDITPPPMGGASGASFEPGPISEEELARLASAACVTFIEEPDLPPLALQLVIDVSGSMSFTPAGATESKWDLTEEAIERAVDDLPGTVSLGAVFFPNQETHANCAADSDPCVPGAAQDVEFCLNTSAMLPIAPLEGEDSEQRAALEDAMFRVNAAGGTPTHDALDVALEDLLASPDVTARFLLLMTDGQPTYLQDCRGSGDIDQPVSVEPIISAIETAAAEGIRTFVVGAPGSERTAGDSGDARTWLSRAALAGQTAPERCSESGPDFCHVDLSNEDEDFGPALVETLSQIMASTRPCQFEIPDPPGAQPLDYDAINMVLKNSSRLDVVLGKGDTACDEGWQLDDENGTVTLCPDSCSRYRADPDSTIELFFGCESAPAPRPT